MRWLKAANTAGFVLTLLSIAACVNHAGQTPIAGIEAWPRSASPVRDSAAEAAKIGALLARMTVEEKVGQIMRAEIQAIIPEEVKTYHIGSMTQRWRGTVRINGIRKSTISKWRGANMGTGFNAC